jgi:hypothetical protein
LAVIERANLTPGGAISRKESEFQQPAKSGPEIYHLSSGSGNFFSGQMRQWILIDSDHGVCYKSLRLKCRRAFSKCVAYPK